EIAADDPSIRRERVLDSRQASGRKYAVGVQKQKNVATRLPRAGAKLVTATAQRLQQPCTIGAGNLDSGIAAATVDDDGLVFAALVWQRRQQPGQRLRLVQSRDDNRNHAPVGGGPAEHEPPPSTQNRAQCGWLSATALLASRRLRPSSNCRS